MAVRLLVLVASCAVFEVALPVAFILLTALNPALINTMNRCACNAPWHRPDEAIQHFIESRYCERDAVYRVLGYSDGRASMLRLIQHGGRLDGEFFPESQARRLWSSVADHERAMNERQVEYVIAWRSYDNAGEPTSAPC